MFHSLKDTRSQRVNDLSRPDPELSDAAEEKRLAARRRFLLGGAAAVPMVVTAIRAEALNVGVSVCLSMFPGGGGPMMSVIPQEGCDAIGSPNPEDNQIRVTS